MPRGPAPPWTQRLEPILDHLLHESVNQAGGQHNENGAYAELKYTGCATPERAADIKRALHRAGKHTGYSVRTWITQQTDGTYTVHFCAHDKSMAKAYVLKKYGPDRSKWPYDPRRKGAA